MKYTTNYKSVLDKNGMCFIDANGSEHIHFNNESLIIKYPNSKTIKVTSGGDESQKIKNILNKYLPSYLKSDWKIISEYNQWFLFSKVWNKKIVFFDNMQVHITELNDIRILQSDYILSMEEIQERKTDVQKYARSFIDLFMNHKINLPSSLDCFYCVSNIYSTQHLIIHIYEKEYVPSLLLNSINENPSCLLSNQEKTEVINYWIKNIDKLDINLRTLLIKNLTKYVSLKVSMPI